MVTPNPLRSSSLAEVPRQPWAAGLGTAGALGLSKGSGGWPGCSRRKTQTVIFPCSLRGEAAPLLLRAHMSLGH